MPVGKQEFKMVVEEQIENEKKAAPLYAKEILNFNDELVSVLFLMYYLATTVTRLSVGRIVGRIRKSTLVIISIGLAALFFLP